MSHSLSLVSLQARACSGSTARLSCSRKLGKRAIGHHAPVNAPPASGDRGARRWIQCQAARNSVSGSMNDDGTITLPSVELEAGENGKYKVNGIVELESKPADVYDVLVDFEGAHDIFSNIEGTEVMESEDGKVTLLQRCRWTFLVFSGTFKAAMSVRQVPDQRVLLFDLVEPGFMQEFEGRWKVMESESGGSIVEHTLAVKPSMAPPGGLMSGYTRKIFVEQELQVLKDLELELERRAANVPAYVSVEE